MKMDVKNKKKKNKKIIHWLFWLLLVVLWNYGYPEAIPFYDVIIALALSLFFIFLKKTK